MELKIRITKIKAINQIAKQTTNLKRKHQQNIL